MSRSPKITPYGFKCVRNGHLTRKKWPDRRFDILGRHEPYDWKDPDPTVMDFPGNHYIIVIFDNKSVWFLDPHIGQTYLYERISTEIGWTAFTVYFNNYDKFRVKSI